MYRQKNERPANRGTRYQHGNRSTARRGGQCTGQMNKTSCSSPAGNSEWKGFAKPSYRNAGLSGLYQQFKCEQAASERASSGTRSAQSAGGVSGNSRGADGAGSARRESSPLHSESETRSSGKRSSKGAQTMSVRRLRSTTQSGRGTCALFTKKLDDLLINLLIPRSEEEKAYERKVHIEFYTMSIIFALVVFVFPRLCYLGSIWCR